MWRSQHLKFVSHNLIKNNRSENGDNTLWRSYKAAISNPAKSLRTERLPHLTKFIKQFTVA